jgi:hypothetical protein
VIIYWRSAFAELLAASLLPLLLLLLLRKEEKRGTVLLALILGASWVVNAPAAVMIHYSMVLLIVVIAWQRRSARILLTSSAAVVLGGALAAFYLFPAIYEQKWVDIAQAVSEGARPADNFLFVHTPDADHDTFNRLISWVVVAELALTIAAAAATRCRSHNRELWNALAIWAAVCMVLMLAMSNPLWMVLPKLSFMQFPWRWMLCLGVPFTFFIVVGVRKWPARVALYVAMLCLVGFVGQHFRPPWWDGRADLRKMRSNMATGAGYEGTDEYAPAGADPSSVDKAARRVTVDGTAHAAIRVSEWSAENKIFTAEMSAPDNLALHLFYYPAWRVEVNGRVVQASARDGTGQMLVPVEAGANRVQINFVRTWDRRLGGWISLLVVILMLASTQYEVELTWTPKRVN